MATIAERIEKLPMTRTAWTILMIVGVGWMFDAMDQGMVSGVIASIGTDWNLSLYEKSWLINSGIIGMILGAALDSARNTGCLSFSVLSPDSDWEGSFPRHPRS